MDKDPQALLQRVTDALFAALGENLWSCCVYGSYARGNPVVGLSDINLLVVLADSQTAAHVSLSQVLSRFAVIDPLVVGRDALVRTARCFANKFSSIQRNYRVLHGADPFLEFKVDPSLERLLCEQALRNTRLRTVYTFVTDSRSHRYRGFVIESVSAIFLQLSDVVLLSGRTLERDFAARIPVLTEVLHADARTLQDLLALRSNPKAFAQSEVAEWHRRVLALLDRALQWIEANWAEPRLNC